MTAAGIVFERHQANSVSVAVSPAYRQILNNDPCTNATLRDIAGQLERMHERTPRGGRQWHASSVKALLDRARRLGLVAPDQTPGL